MTTSGRSILTTDSSTNDMMDIFFSDDFLDGDEDETKEITGNKNKVVTTETPSNTENKNFSTKATENYKKAITIKDDLTKKSTTDTFTTTRERQRSIQEVERQDARIAAKIASSRKLQVSVQEASTTKTPSLSSTDESGEFSETTTNNSATSTRERQRSIQEVERRDARIAAKIASSRKLQGSVQEASTTNQKIIAKLRENMPIGNNNNEDVLTPLRSSVPTNLSATYSLSSRGSDDVSSGPSLTTSTDSLRSRISDLAYPHEDDFVENVYGERIDTSIRNNNIMPSIAMEENFTDHVTHNNNSEIRSIRNISMSTPTINSEPSRSNSSRGGGTSNNYLNTRATDMEDSQHQHDLAMALQNTNFGLNNQQEQKQEKDEAPSFRLKAFVLLFIFAGIIIGVIVVVMEAAKKSSSSSDSSPTTAPSIVRQTVYQDMYNFLSSQSDMDNNLFNDPSSPQAQSLKWLVFSDGLELVPNKDTITDHHILQRHALMTTYYTIPILNRNNLNWGTTKLECEW
eukprot:CAMPEP_0197840714 /NCGR_PEP_ID=MMETSP1437-20131217/45760_1 /TAXON_ID=49252 ORGANISM="Eucampia antarctica, Strain CCMP1452" /NCGR_SAMPLE_ID=MMETSP1437 /ASSEMBLY_ACC=CAM_ASM_001096 /LENGTH=514 /DNA_ID=CAMNT_0043450359 /DNA_START=41 /DNA_END=1582 /DNA_ORIENTATION=+